MRRTCLKQKRNLRESCFDESHRAQPPRILLLCGKQSKESCSLLPLLGSQAAKGSVPALLFSKEAFLLEVRL